VQQEPVLVQDRLPGPAPGPVELQDEAALVLQLHLVDPVLEGAERQAAAGAAEPAHLDRLEHAGRREGEERRGGWGGHRASSVPHAPLRRTAPTRSRVAHAATPGGSAPGAARSGLARALAGCLPGGGREFLRREAESLRELAGEGLVPDDEG